MASIFTKSINGVSYIFEQMNTEKDKKNETTYRVTYNSGEITFTFRLTKDNNDYYRISKEEKIPEHLFNLEAKFNKAINEQ